MVNKTTNSLTPIGFQEDKIDLKENMETSIPPNYELSLWKVSKIVTSILSLGALPLLYYITISIINTLTLIYYTIHDGGKIYNTEYELDNQNAISTVNNLNSMKQLSGSSIIVLDDLLQNKNEHFISTNGIPNDQEIKEAIQKNKRIIIPVVLKGGFFTRGIYSRDHITTLIIDPNKKKIIYIDPKGKTLFDHKSQKVKKLINSQEKNPETLTVEEIFKNIITQIKTQNPEKDDKTPETWSLLQNVEHYQYDGYNCGVHFLHNAKEYASTGEIPSQLKNLEEIRRCRKKIIDDITKNFPSENNTSNNQNTVTKNKDEMIFK